MVYSGIYGMKILRLVGRPEVFWQISLTLHWYLFRLFMLLVGGWIPSPKYMTQWPSRAFNLSLTIQLRTLAGARYLIFYLIRDKTGICAIRSVIFKNRD